LAQAVGAAHVNLRGLTAAGLGRKFVCYLGCDNRRDANRAATAIRALGRKKK
jgi:hypothetical protein